MSGVLLAEDREYVTPLGVPLRQEPLPFDFDALEPHFDAATLKMHHATHHLHIVKKLDETLKEMRLDVGNLVALMPDIRTLVLPPDPLRKVVRMGGPPEQASLAMQNALRVYGGAHINHTAFWRFLAPPGTSPEGPEGKVAQAICDEFGTVDEFRRAFTDAAMRHFGSGWAWLVYRPDGSLVIATTQNEDNPLMTDFVLPAKRGRPILCLDLWEHSYYLKYRNDRRKYIDAWWNVVNWNFVSRAYAIVTSNGRV